MKIFSLLAVFMLAACTQDDGCIDPSKIDPDALCYMIYSPVCGCDGKTYGNDCIARNAGVTRWSKGVCN